MPDDDLDLARHLFAKATALLEQAHAVATNGQSAELGDIIGLAARVGSIAEDVAVLAHTIEIVALGSDAGTKRPDSDR